MELTIYQALQQGVAAHKEGKLQDAERLYRAILKTQPNHPDANHNLGVLAVAVGKPLEAVPLFKLAVDTIPQVEQFWLSYIDALIKVGHFEDAKKVLVAGAKSVVSAEKLDAFQQQLAVSAPRNANKAEKKQALSEKRKKLAEDKKNRKRKARGAMPGAEPSPDQLNYLLEHYQAGRLDEAAALATSLTQKFPNHAFAWKALGTLLQQTGKANESLSPMKKSVELLPHDAEAHRNLGVTLQELGRLDEAAASYRQAIDLKPNYPDAHSNLGVTLKELGKFDEAEASYRQATLLKPDFAEAYSNLGNLLQALGRLDEAESSFEQAITLKPDFAEAYYNLGNTLKELGRLDEAEASYRRAILMKPGYFEAHSNLGVTVQQKGRLDEAEASFRKAIALKSDYAQAHFNLCELFEKTNRIDELFSALEEAKNNTDTMKADFLCYEALASFREERYVEADTLVARIVENEVSETRKAAYFKLVGDLHHRNSEYDAAFLAYKNSNRAIKTSVNYQRLKKEAAHYFDAQRDTLSQLQLLSNEVPYPHRLPPGGRQPTFLVGFPRSGTTLLDTILRTHSKINVVEEQPIVAKMRSALGYPRGVSDIEVIDKDDLVIAVDAYSAELANHTAGSAVSVIIDKLPLNLLQAPLINRVFPGAKFILALRHPLDCVLSCWMQNFNLNNAMANMVDLNRIVEFYCVAMGVFQLSQKRYGLDVHRVRYEDLVNNLEREATSILNFLNLDWEADLLNYQATAMSRQRIRTPSHSQVIRQIYRTASYRWKHYEKHLEKFKPQLARWFEEYDY